MKSASQIIELLRRENAETDLCCRWMGMCQCMYRTETTCHELNSEPSETATAWGAWWRKPLLNWKEEETLVPILELDLEDANGLCPAISSEAISRGAWLLLFTMSDGHHSSWCHGIMMSWWKQKRRCPGAGSAHKALWAALPEALQVVPSYSWLDRKPKCELTFNFKVHYRGD